MKRSRCNDDTDDSSEDDRDEDENDMEVEAEGEILEDAEESGAISVASLESTGTEQYD